MLRATNTLLNMVYGGGLATHHLLLHRLLSTANILIKQVNLLDLLEHPNKKNNLARRITSLPLEAMLFWYTGWASLPTSSASIINYFSKRLLLKRPYINFGIRGRDHTYIPPSRVL